MDLQEDRCYATGDQLAPTFIFASPNQYHTGMATWIAQQPPEKQTQIDLLTPVKFTPTDRLIFVQSIMG
ncbi:hypothetical protein PGTUg99_033014 [Puccinia graminis f. sp. tritici]|nr:hypothetical protein PGTUg99_033014 [Puccinia graminis f. sp. tritici]